ncbi:MAG: shikimate kinase [Pyrinomonadaceae bacterium]
MANPARTRQNFTTRRIALTGFMGVGKTSVSRHLARMLGCERLDLDALIEVNEQRRVAEIIDAEGIDGYRSIETENLKKALARTAARILSLGGGAWTVEENRRLIHEAEVMSVWLDASFNHCWNNIRLSRKERPLARDKTAAERLFDERQAIYCLADWHFVVRPDQTSFDVASQIAEEVFS